MGEVIKPSGGSGAGGSSSASSILVAPVSRFGVNINDAVMLNANGMLYPAQLTDTCSAGATSMAVAANTTTVTTLSGGSTNTAANDVKQSAYVNPSDASIFVAWPNLATNQGLIVQKVSATGTVGTSLVLDASGSTGVVGINIVPLSNNNLAIVWGYGSGQFFAIIDKSMNLIVAKTSFGAAQTSGPFLHACGLSGGGFAITYSGTAGNAALLAIYTNTGAVTLAPTVIASSPTGGAMAKIAQLSNGNLVVVISSTDASKAIGRSIFTSAGAAVSAYSVIDASTKSLSSFPDVSVLSTGYFAVVCNITGTIKAFVQNNAGATQGSSFGDAAAATTSDAKLTNDGTAFWMAYSKSAGATGSIAFLPITGGSFAVINIMPQSTADYTDIVYNRDFVLTNSPGGINVYTVTTAGVASYSTSITTGSTPFTGNFVSALKAMPDFTVLKVMTTNAQMIGGFRYAACSLMGVARATIPPGNPGALLSVNVGPASVLMNAVPGKPSSAFDHSAANVPGNHGVLFNNSISMKGI